MIEFKKGNYKKMIDLNYNLLEKNHIKKLSDEEKQIEIEKIEGIFNKYKVLIKCDDVIYTHSRRIYYIDPFGKNKVYRINDIASLKVEIGMYYDDVEEIEIERIPGTSYVGIYMLLKERDNYRLGSVIKSIKEYKKKMNIPIVFGTDKNGKNIVEDLVNIPHILISGQTGSGKTNMLTSILMQLILQFEPKDLQIAILDSRGICFKDFLNNEYSLLREIKSIHTMCGMVAWLKQEMEIRYIWFSNKNVKDIFSYNKIAEEKLPYIRYK
jgi:S-DNA-T family DNA segregation ATPase FtsK/SpoIIIE